jgi:AcrR family transcriptional regulator
MRSTPPTDDRKTAARIRDAAIVRFGDVGFAKATVRDIAAAAGVSPGLILHHFGSKEGLRQACDEHVVAAFAYARTATGSSGSTDPFAAMATIQAEEHLTRYLLQSFREGSPASARLFQGLVDETVRLMELSIDEGIIRPSANLYDESVVLVAWQFGGLILMDHAARAMGIAPDSEDMKRRYIPAVLHVLTHGVFADTRYEDAWKEFATSGEPPPPQEETPERD